MVRRLDDQRGIAVCLSNLANTAHLEGNLVEAQTHFEEAVTIARRIGDRASQCYSELRLADLAARLGDLDRAEHATHEALLLAIEVEDRGSICLARLNLGDYARPLARGRDGDLAPRLDASRAPGGRLP